MFSVVLNRAVARIKNLLNISKRPLEMNLKLLANRHAMQQVPFSFPFSLPFSFPLPLAIAAISRRPLRPFVCCLAEAVKMERCSPLPSPETDAQAICENLLLGALHHGGIESDVHCMPSCHVVSNLSELEMSAVQWGPF